MWDKTKELTGALGAAEALLEFALLEVLQCCGQEGLGDEGVLRGVGVGLGEVVQSLDGHACVLFEDSAEAAEQAYTQDEG